MLLLLILIYIQATLARLFPSVSMCLFDMMQLGHHCRPPTMAPIKFWTAHPSTLLLILRVDGAPSLSTGSNRLILIPVQSTMSIHQNLHDQQLIHPSVLPLPRIFLNQFLLALGAMSTGPRLLQNTFPSGSLGGE